MPGSRPPISLVQDVRASPPSPSGIDRRTLARKVSPRGANPRPPTRVTKRTDPPAPIRRVLQGLGNASQMDTSVSAQSRATRQLFADGVQVSGDYVDAIRQAAGFAFGPPRLPKQGFAASSYPYPSRMMVIGATLAGTPIVAPAPQGRPPQVTRRPGFPMQISTSPSEERRRLISTLRGLGALNPDTSKYHFADSDWFQSTKRDGCWLGVDPGANANGPIASDCQIPASVAQKWAAHCAETYGGPGGDAGLHRACLIVPTVAALAPWSAGGKQQRGLPIDWARHAAGGGTKVLADLESGLKQNEGSILTPGGGTGGAGGVQVIGPGSLKTGLIGTPGFVTDQLKPLPKTAGIGTIGAALAVAGVAAVAYALTR